VVREDFVDLAPQPSREMEPLIQLVGRFGGPGRQVWLTHNPPHRYLTVTARPFNRVSRGAGLPRRDQNKSASSMKSGAVYADSVTLGVRVCVRSEEGTR
jgi:hypothetical protein